MQFSAGHLPGATSLPLFSDRERHLVGLTYKRQGTEPAIALGFSQAQPKLREMREEAWRRCRPRGHARWPVVGVYCWRGGMRSRCVAWWLRQAGLAPVLLRGGYKHLKEHCAHLYWPLSTPEELAQLVRGHAVADDATGAGFAAHTRPRIVIVGGRTGSGKTRVLASLRDQFGQQVLDLEGLANHRGSAFGWIAQLPQPTTEQYALDVAFAWRALDPARVVFVEDEGSAVGKVSVPPLLFAAMRRAPLIVKLVVPLEARLDLLVEDYAGEAAKAQTADWGPRMEEAITRMGKRLGGDTVAALLARLVVGDVRGVALQLLSYYDKLYDKHVENASGSGRGSGARPGCLVEAAVDPAALRLDDQSLAALVLERAAAHDFG